MVFVLSAVGAGVQNYRLPFHPLLSACMFKLPALGVLNLRKSISGGEFTRAIYLKEVKNLLSEEKLPTWFQPFNFEALGG